MIAERILTHSPDTSKKTLRVYALGEPESLKEEIPYAFCSVQMPEDQASQDGVYSLSFELRTQADSVTHVSYTNLPHGNEYKRIREVLLADADVVVLAFSMFSPQSLQNIITKYSVEVEHVSSKILVGTRCQEILSKTVQDQLYASRKEPVSNKEIQQAQNKLRADEVILVQSLEHFGLDELFIALERFALPEATQPDGPQ